MFFLAGSLFGRLLGLSFKQLSKLILLIFFSMQLLIVASDQRLADKMIKAVDVLDHAVVVLIKRYA